MSPRSHEDPETAERRRRARRLARELHPDLGGDPEAYIRAVQDLDREQRPQARVGPGPAVVVAPSRWWTRPTRLARRGLRRWRRRRRSGPGWTQI